MGKYLDKIRGLEPGERAPSNAPQQAAPVPAIQPGSFVTWTRGDGTRPEGFVDLLYTDSDGKAWAFVSYRKTWAVVSMKFLTKVNS